MGRPEAAASGALWILAAGPAALEERCGPLLAAMGRGYTWLGDDPRLANVAKLSLNLLLLGILESLAEALVPVRKSGGDPALVLGVASQVFASPVLEGYGRKMLSGSFTPPGFTLGLALKDADLLQGVARSAAAPAPVAGVVRDRLLAGYARGHGDEDLAALIRVALEQAGLA
jgi:3-hydroxyisobutyrate dehydrogenase-like beta-hydroxyacid dehydrogenase